MLIDPASISIIFELASVERCPVFTDNFVHSPSSFENKILLENPSANFYPKNPRCSAMQSLKVHPLKFTHVPPIVTILGGALSGLLLFFRTPGPGRSLTSWYRLPASCVSFTPDSLLACYGHPTRWQPSCSLKQLTLIRKKTTSCCLLSCHTLSQCPV